MKLTGHYIRIASSDSAEIRLTPMLLGKDRYHVTGQALWGEQRTYGPNMGEIDFAAELDGNILFYSNGEYRLELKFSGEKLEVREENWVGVHGANVTFIGTYQKAPGLKPLVSGLIPTTIWFIPAILRIFERLLNWTR